LAHLIDRLGGSYVDTKLRFGSRLAGVHRAASDDLYDAGSKPDQREISSKLRPQLHFVTTPIIIGNREAFL
jgi:hypothetical protein